jgi:hypothetical protein
LACDSATANAGWKEQGGAAINPRDELKPERVKMTTFDDREKAFEHKFEHDMELQFKARARSNKLLGLWAAGLMGKSGADAEAYSQTIVMADFEEPGDHDVVRTLMRDLAAAGKPTEEHTVRKQGDRFLVEATRQVMSEVKK